MSPSPAERMRELAFFRPFSAAALQALVEIGSLRSVTAGTVLFRQGERHPHIYVIALGSVALDMAVPRQGAVRVLSLGPGDLLGWSPLVGSSAMTATATALEDSELIDFPAVDLIRLCETDPGTGYPVLLQVAEALSHRLLATRLQLLDLLAETTYID